MIIHIVDQILNVLLENASTEIRNAMELSTAVTPVTKVIIAKELSKRIKHIIFTFNFKETNDLGVPVICSLVNMELVLARS